MVYTVTFNPAVDYIVKVGGLKLGETNRSVSEELQFGGKGINVSAVLAELGVPSVALGFVAGFTGDELARAVAEKGIRTDLIRLEKGNTRINIKLKDDAETEINASGPEITDRDVQMLFEKLEQVRPGDTLVLAGSVPPSLPGDIYEKILERLDGRGIRLVVDAAKDLLLNVLRFKPFLIKPNRRELEELAGCELKSDAEITKAAAKLKENGAQNVLVSLGAEGALLLDAEGKTHKMPAVGGKPVNTVGAGDSMVAGFIAGVDKGYEYALRLGLAAGGATACSETLANITEILNLM